MRTAGIFSDTIFDTLLFFFPLALLFVCQSMNGLASAWLDVAIKSDKMNGGASVKK
jgi:hypothetical protein